MVWQMLDQNHRNTNTKTANENAKEKLKEEKIRTKNGEGKQCYNHLRRFSIVFRKQTQQGNCQQENCINKAEWKKSVIEYFSSGELSVKRNPGCSMCNTQAGK